MQVIVRARLLIVEDRELIAAKVGRAVSEAGHQVVAMAPTVGAALTALLTHGEAIDAAILDIDLRGEPVYPIAELLDERGAPFVFLTGYGASAIDPLWRWVHRVEKPFETAVLVRALDDALNDRPGPSPGRSAVSRTTTNRLAMDMIRDTRDAITEARAMRESQAASAEGEPRD